MSSEIEEVREKILDLEMLSALSFSCDNDVEDPSLEDLIRRGSKRTNRPRRASPTLVHDGSGVHGSTNSAPFSKQQQMSRLLGRTRSRLMDPLPSATSAASVVGEANGGSKYVRLKAGLLGRSSSSRLDEDLKKDEDEDDEDPFVVDDITKDRKNRKKVGIILQWVSLFLMIVTLTCIVSIPAFRRYEVGNIHIWKLLLMVLVIICGHLLSGLYVRLLVYAVEHKYILHTRYLYFVYGVRNALQNFIWNFIVLIVWLLTFHEKTTLRTPLPFVTNVLMSLLVTGVLRLFKTSLIKYLAAKFHVSAYFHRIQESIFHHYIIQTLSGLPLYKDTEENKLMEENKLAEGVQKQQKAGGKINGIKIEQLHKLNQKNVSAWNMKRLVSIIRYGTLTTFDQQLAQIRSDHELAQIRSDHEAMLAAKKIFSNVAKPGSKYIYLVDLMRFMREDEALKTLALFECANDNSKVSRKCLKNWVVNVFRERKHLALTLNDTKTAINKLHQMANAILAIILVVLWILILDIAKWNLFVIISSQLLLAVFMFGDSLKRVFESTIFLFMTHPFDIGDRCEINGVQMVVEEMNILTTIFLRFDNQKITYPNNQLATLPIGNYYRSPDMGDSIEFCIHVSTPVEKIATMKERLINYMESRPEHWYPDPQIVFKEVEDMDRLRISIWMRHTLNFQDMKLRRDRRELVMQEMIKVLRELEIEHRVLPVDVNIRSMPPITSDRLPSTWKTSLSL